MEVSSGKESREKEVEGERMTEEEFKNQHNRFSIVVIFNEQLYIGPLNNEIIGLEWMLRYYFQQHKMADQKKFESYAENRNLRDTIKTLQESMGSSPGADPAANESPPPLITRLRNRNACGETWDDVLSSLNQYSNVTKTVEQVSCSQESDVAQESWDQVGQQVVREQLLTEPVSTKSLVIFSVIIFAAFDFVNIAVSTILSPRRPSLTATITFLLFHSLPISFTFSSSNDVIFALNGD